MRAVQLVGKGGLSDVRLIEVPVPHPGPDEVLVRVAASSLNRLDLAAIFNWSPSAINYPITLGIDPAGTVVDVGAEVKERRIDDRILVKPTTSCSECRYCIANHDESCESRTTFGLDQNGGLAEYISVPEQSAYVVAPTTDLIAASAFAHSFPVAYEMLHMRAAAAPSDNILVMGASGAVGSAATQLAGLMSEHVVAVSRNTDAVEVSSASRSVTVVEYGEDPEELAVKIRAGFGGGRADVIIDPNADEGLWTVLPELLQQRGRIVFCGTGAVRSLPLDPFWLYRTRASVIGSAGASQRAFRAGLELLDRGSITPKIDAIVPLEEIHGGYEKLRTRGNRGKLVVAI